MLFFPCSYKDQSINGSVLDLKKKDIFFLKQQNNIMQTSDRGSQYLGCFSRSRLTTELDLPTITLAMSDAYPIVISQGMLWEAKASSMASKSDCPVTMLHTSLDRNHVTALEKFYPNT